MKIQFDLQTERFEKTLEAFWRLSSEKILRTEKEYDKTKGSPVFTIQGKYTGQSWTEWTRGFQYGSAILQFEATGDKTFLKIGRENTVNKMAVHLSHAGVHDHGFNNISTFGNLLRLLLEEKIEYNEWEREYYELALKISGAVQAGRWTKIEGGGFIYSFNGPHSLFVDTIRSCRILGVSHLLGHTLQAENDERINLLRRAIQHLMTTAKYSIFYGKGRDSYDVRGRTTHEIIFNAKNGNYRCPNSQQGYSGFSTWTRGLAWAMTGFAEELEFMNSIEEEEFSSFIEKEKLLSILLEGAKATCDFYLANTPIDGIPYWDCGAPDLHKMGDYLTRKSDPFNDFEPVDSSAAAIAAQGLLRLGKYLTSKGNSDDGKKYFQAGLTVIENLFAEPYLSQNPQHQGLILHSIYHRPNGWDYIPKNSKIPYGESSMWGDYHAREAALLLQKMIQDEPYYTFYNCVGKR